ncbi:MAG: 16S rRNA (cytosine(1402)-N(4))-methyltransferase RsmH [Verrucomicrobiales bacterium]|nr:16S rRNA (cytosine(1402)-N(4))-methyltransferase RsmH [Verrucomicrobiales bacterium]
MSDSPPPDPTPGGVPTPHRRRPRYPGRNPRRFEDKYKERDPQRFQETIEKVLASGKTPAGTHRPILVPEILDLLSPSPGEVAVDCTLGYGGHAEAILHRLQPGGRLVALDTDPLELAKTEARLRAAGWTAASFTAVKSNYAGLPKVLSNLGLESAHVILADLGLSSMQIDDPQRGFSVKFEGPLDMRMDPTRGPTAAGLLQRLDAPALARLLVENADEPQAHRLAPALAGRSFATTAALSEAIRLALAALHVASITEVQLTVRRVFQALRIAVNDEFSALETLLRHLPGCLAPGGRVAVLTFHSGEDRRVKKAFEAGRQAGLYAAIAEEVIRPSAEEQRANPRSSPAKLRWAKRTAP